MVKLGQKLQLSKTSEKRLQNHILLCKKEKANIPKMTSFYKSAKLATLELLCAKNGSKNTYYSKNDKFPKIGNISHYAKAIAFKKWSVLLKY